MKICLVAPVPPFSRGIPKYCYSLAQELEKRHDLMLLSYKRQYPELLYGKRSQVDPGCDVARIRNEFKHLSYDIDSVSLLSWHATTIKIAEFDPDLVILPWWVTYWAPMYAYLVFSLKKKGIKVIFLCINVFEHEHNVLKKLLTKLVLGRVDSMIVHSEQEKNTALEINPRATVKKHLLPLFKYDEASMCRDDTRLHLLFFGLVRPYKGLDILIRAVGILKEYDISLKVAGEFWDSKAEILNLARKLDISHKVEIFDRYIPDDEMSLFFSWADLVVLPYKQSITSGIVATAYGFKKPVLATNVGGFHEVVKDGFTGRIVLPGDPRAIADGVLWFLKNRHINFAENIAEFTSQNMSWGSLVTMIEGFDKGTF